jgi:hypothetical protein
MSIKLLLAESLDVLRKAEDMEAGADQLQIATAKGQTKTRDFMRVRSSITMPMIRTSRASR